MSSGTSSSHVDILEGVDLENSSLSTLFDVGWQLQLDLDKQSDETSPSYQLKRSRLIELFKKCEFMLDELHLFSANEEIDEISTSEMRYMLVYALLAWFHSKVGSIRAEVRLGELRAAKYYFQKYLQLTKNYGLHSFAIEKASSASGTTNTMSAQAAFDQNMVRIY